MNNRPHDDPSGIEYKKQQTFRVDTTIPLYLVFFLALQLGSAVWWASSRDNMITNNDQRIIVLETETKNRTERLARIETQLTNSAAQLTRIEDLVTRHMEAGRR